MKSLLIEIEGHQTIEKPTLHLTLQIGDQVYEFDPESRLQTWSFLYDDRAVNYHYIQITLHNKQYLVEQSEHDLSDLCYVIDSIKFDGTEVTSILETQARYRHCNNGSGPEALESYTSWLGCDGVLEFTIATPIFCWWLLARL